MADGWTDFSPEELQQAMEQAASGFDPGGQSFGDNAPPADQPPMDTGGDGGDNGYAPSNQSFGNEPSDNQGAPLVPMFNDVGGLLGFSAGYGMGPGNEATGQEPFGLGLPKEQQFGDVNKWIMGPSSEDPNNYIPIPYAVEGARPMGPTLEAIANSGRLGNDLDRYGFNIGPALGTALNRMGEIDAEQRRQQYSPQYQRQFEQNWVNDARNNNLLTVRPEEQPDKSINRVFTYESGRQESVPYQAAPPKPTYGGGSGGDGSGGGRAENVRPTTTTDRQMLGLGEGSVKVVQADGNTIFFEPDGSRAVLVDKNGNIIFDQRPNAPGQSNYSSTPWSERAQQEPGAYARPTPPSVPIATPQSTPETSPQFGPAMPEGAPRYEYFAFDGQTRLYYDNVTRTVVPESAVPLSQRKPSITPQGPGGRGY